MSIIPEIREHSRDGIDKTGSGKLGKQYAVGYKHIEHSYLIGIEKLWEQKGCSYKAKRRSKIYPERTDD